MANPNLSSPSRRSVLTGMRDAMTGVIDLYISSSKKEGDILKVFYDSEIGSPIEKSVEKVISVSVYKSLIKYFPKLKFEGKTAIAVGRSVLFLLDRSKLMYHYRKGRINETRYYDELAKRYASIVVAVVRRGEDMLMMTLPRLLEDYCKIPKEFTLLGLQKVFKIITPTEEQVSRLIKEGIRRANVAIDKVDKKLSAFLNRAKEYIRETKRIVKERVDKKLKRRKK